VGLVFAVVFLTIGAYCLWLGWQRLRATHPRRAPLSLPEQAALALVRLVQDEAGVAKWRREILHPARLRRFAAFYLLAGIVATVAGVVQALAWLDAR
jgi:hypothetical protein